MKFNNSFGIEPEKKKKKPIMRVQKPCFFFSFRFLFFVFKLILPLLFFILFFMNEVIFNQEQGQLYLYNTNPSRGEGKRESAQTFELRKRLYLEIFFTGFSKKLTRPLA
jgi:hypothetical protein